MSPALTFSANPSNSGFSLTNSSRSLSLRSLDGRLLELGGWVVVEVVVVVASVVVSVASFAPVADDESNGMAREVILVSCQFL